jgi:hypothetical protein
MDDLSARAHLRHQFNVLRISLMLMLTVIAVNVAARVFVG